MTSGEDVGGKAAEVEPPQPVFHYILLPNDRRQQGSLTKWHLMVEVQMNQRCGNESLHAEKIAPTDIHLHLLNVRRDQTVDVFTVRDGWCISAGVTADYLCCGRLL